MKKLPLQELRRITSYFHEGNMIFTYKAHIKNAEFIGKPKDKLIGLGFDTKNEKTNDNKSFNLGFDVIADLQFNDEVEFDSSKDSRLSYLFKIFGIKQDDNPVKIQIDYKSNVSINLNYISNITINDIIIKEKDYYFTENAFDYSELTNLYIQKIELSENIKNLFNDEVTESAIINAIIKDYNLFDEYEKRINYALKEQIDPIVTYYHHEKIIPKDM